ncbi:hypothetical protein R3P38DRAFT_3438212 [Favolaschia claudopus]|uniref:Uncharacterized protein n=1 Tax=Favolaschia claudopus TaxID=2862362 RepID=A0AAV9ZSK8_9AGAR
MHPSLQTSNVADLPTSCRKYASNAAAGSAKDLNMLFLLMDADKIPATKLSLLLPVFYQNLDVRGCPTLDSVDVQGPNFISPIVRALGSMKGLFMLREKNQITSEVGEALWPRLWTWIQALDLYRDVVKQIVEVSWPEYMTYNLFVAMFYLARPNPGAVLLADIPSLRAILARAWMFFVQADALNEPGFNTVAMFFFSDAAPARSDHLSEYIDGAGGTIDAFAGLVMDYFALSFPSRHSGRMALSSANYHFSIGLIRLLIEGEEADDPLSTVLLNRGFIRQLTALTCLYGHDAQNDWEEGLLQLCLSLLNNKLTAFAGYQAVGDALCQRLNRAAPH